MQFHVISDQGQKFGPASIIEINQWIIEGRIKQTFTFEAAKGGAIFNSTNLPGIVWQASEPVVPPFTPQQPTVQQPPTVYPRADYPPIGTAPMNQPLNWIDKQFVSTSKAMLIIGSVCLAGISFILAIIQLSSGKDPIARKNAILCLKISVPLILVYTILRMI